MGARRTCGQSTRNEIKKIDHWETYERSVWGSGRRGVYTHGQDPAHGQRRLGAEGTHCTCHVGGRPIPAKLGFNSILVGIRHLRTLYAGRGGQFQPNLELIIIRSWFWLASDICAHAPLMISPHVRTMWVLNTCGRANEINLPNETDFENHRPSRLTNRCVRRCKAQAQAWINFESHHPSHALPLWLQVKDAGTGMWMYEGRPATACAGRRLLLVRAKPRSIKHQWGNVGSLRCRPPVSTHAAPR